MPIRACGVPDGSVLKGPIQEVEDIIFDSIDGDLIHKVAKKISGAAGPSGVDAEGWQRVLCSKQFKKKPDKLTVASRFPCTRFYQYLFVLYKYIINALIHHCN